MLAEIYIIQSKIKVYVVMKKNIVYIVVALLGYKIADPQNRRTNAIEKSNVLLNSYHS